VVVVYDIHMLLVGMNVDESTHEMKLKIGIYGCCACVVLVMVLPVSIQVVLVIICRSWFRENW